MSAVSSVKLLHSPLWVTFTIQKNQALIYSNDPVSKSTGDIEGRQTKLEVLMEGPLKIYTSVTYHFEWKKSKSAADTKAAE